MSMTIKRRRQGILLDRLPSGPTPTPTTPVPTSSINPNIFAPTAEGVFGPKPWIENATGQVLTTGVTYSYNKYYFATPKAAHLVAEMVGNGARVIEVYDICQFGPFAQSHPNQIIKMPDEKDENGDIIKEGRKFNAGLFISFWDHGYSQVYIDRLVRSEVWGINS